MDIGNLKNNYDYYKGFEGEEEIILEFKNNPTYNIHIWCGYFEDIIEEPSLNGKGWKGFTRDFHQDEGAYDEDEYEINIQEYKEDIEQYKNRVFNYRETKEVYELIIKFMEYAILCNESIIMKIS